MQRYSNEFFCFLCIYRIYAPGESVGYTFNNLPEVHNFPSAELASVVMRTTVAHLPRQEKFMKLLCRSLSPTIEQHLRNKKVGGEEHKYKGSPVVGYGDPQPSTSRGQVDHYTSEKQKHNIKSSTMRDNGRSDQQQIKQKPPIGRKSKDDISSVTRTGPCPVSKTPKRKVDQLSPTMKCDYEFPQTSENQSSKCETVTSSQNVTCQTSLPSGKQVAMVTKESLMQTTFISNSNTVVKTYNESKTPEKVIHTKIHPYRKPSTLSVSTNSSLVGSKRLPSPKVLVTGSKKPEPTDYKKRCLDLNLQETSIKSPDDFVGLKPLEEITSVDLNDLIKPLSPSDLEAYLTSLSSKASRRFGASKLDDIPTTKCSFYLGDKNNSCYLEERSSNEQKETVQNLNNVTPAKTHCLSTDPTNEHSSHLSLQKSNDENHVRQLFSRSLSSPEIDAKNVLFENSRICETSEVKDNNLFKTCDEVSPECFLKKKSSKFTQHNIATSISEKSADLHPSKSLSRDAASSCSKERKVDDSREATPTCSKRELTLKTLSIPCRIGADNSAINSLVHNLEDMEIDECSNLASSVDHEVENHFKKEMIQNGFSQKNSLEKNAASVSPDHCDTSPSRDLSLCKQLLKREFQQNVKNVSKYG